MSFFHGIKLPLLVIALVIAPGCRADPSAPVYPQHKGRLLIEEDFADEGWRQRWVVEGNADLSVSEGRLHVRTAAPGKGLEPALTLWWNRPLSASLLIELEAGTEAEAGDNACNLNFIVHAREADGSPYRFGRSGRYADYHSIPNLIFTLTGGSETGWARLRGDPGFRILSEKADLRSEPGRQYRVRIMIEGERVRQWIDGRLVHDYRGGPALPGGHFALRTWKSKVWWSRIRAWELQR